VRSHHEKWDGSGYPTGLTGDTIPIGARILAAVDCLDALASDRQYRKAMPLHEAMARVASQAGSSFDPQVVEILQRRYVELEKMANEQPAQAAPKLSTDIKVERGSAPGAGFAEDDIAANEPARTGDSVTQIAAAKTHAQQIVEFSANAAGSLSMADISSLLAVRLKDLLDYDAIAVYCAKGGVLVAEFATGENSRLFSSLKIPLGDGLVGWVAQNHKAIVNGNPSVEPGYVIDPAKNKTLKSALAMPLEGNSGVVAVLVLYRAAEGVFTNDDLRMVEAIGTGVGAAMEKLVRSRALGAGVGK
jgi:GAF domain-containing protein